MNLNSNNTKEVVKKQQDSLKNTIMKMTSQFKAALPAIITPERMARIAMTAVAQNQKLATCTQESFLGALLTGAQLGLEPNTPLGQCYLIPFQTKTGISCQFQLGYQGLIELCYRSGKYKNIQARVVYEGDVFDYSYGTNEYINHIPKGLTEKPVAVYAYYTLTNGGGTFEVMSWDQILAFSHKYSFAVKQGFSSPWQSDPEAMAKKTLLKKLLKFAPKSVEVADALTYDSGVVNVSTLKEGNETIFNKNIDYTAEYTVQESEEKNDNTVKPIENKATAPAAKQPVETKLSNEEQAAIDAAFDAQAQEYEEHIPDELF